MLVAVLANMQGFKQTQSDGQFFLPFENGFPLAVVVHQFIDLAATLVEEGLQHCRRSRSSRGEFWSPDNVLG